MPDFSLSDGNSGDRFVISLSQCGFVSGVKTLGGLRRLFEVLDRPFLVPAVA